MRKHIVAVAVLSLTSWTPVFAQLDQEESTRSLADVGPFGIVVDVEATQSLAIDSSLGTESLKARLANRLEAMSGRRPVAAPLERSKPYLYVHVNAMQVDDGLIPFSVSASFIQEVRVAAGGLSMMASTWDSGYVGLVSYDRIGAIADACESLVDEFAEDLVAAAGGS